MNRRARSHDRSDPDIPGGRTTMSKERVTGLLIAVLFLHAGVSRAMTPAVCRVDDTPQANAPAKVVHRTVTDTATGLEIRLEQTARGQMTVDVADKTIS